MLRLLNAFVVVALVAAAVVVYDVKYTSTYEAQKVARLDAEIRAEREKIATLKAEWSTLSAPDRIQRLASRYLGMKPLAVSQIGTFTALPERPKTSSGDPIGDIIDALPDHAGGKRDPIGNIIDKMDSARQPEPETTGSIGAPAAEASPSTPTGEPEQAEDAPNSDPSEQDN